MPAIKSQHVVSFSSEDKNHPAENLLKPDGTHKWKGATVGEKQLSVVLQFEKACQIHSIDVGNEGSAFVEILVGRSSSSDVDFQVLLVTSSFMSPMESKNGTNRNAVRMFGPDKLSKTTAGQKWDRVKIVCTQPFNKTSTYGLSFIKFHAPPEPGEKDRTAGTEQGSKTLGKFRLKADNEEKVPLKVGTLFSKRDEPAAAPVTMAAAIHAASRQAEQSRPTPTKPASKETVRDKPTTPSSSQKRKHEHSDEEEKATSKTPSQKTPLRKQPTSISSVSSVGKKDTPPPLKKTKSEPPKESPAKEFKKLMEGVVFVLSGFTNPRRGDIRDEALKMGAQYRPDWGRGCTHLICAFPNTPKYNSVLGKGKIVTRHWVNDCYRKKQLLPWRKYRCGDAETPSESSEDEEEVIPKKKPKTTKKKSDSPEKADLYGGDTDVEEDSGEDTEDELRKLKEKQSEQKLEEKPKREERPKPEGKLEGEDPYGSSTDEDEPTKKSPLKSKPDETSKNQSTHHDDSDSGLPELPDFFTDKKFFLFGDFGASERRLLTRYITAFDGSISEYMADDVHFVVTHSAWDKNFDDALSDAPSLVFVKPKWIFLCNEKNKFVPYQPHVVVPQ